MKNKIKDLIKKGIVVMPGVFNGISAKLAEQAGFDALYISGAGLVNGVAAMPDIGLLTMTEIQTQASYIVNSANAPCIIDGDTGFGEAVNVIRMINTFESIGLAGVHIEDQELPKKCGHLSGKKLVSPQAMVEKIAAAIEARKDPDFLIIARTDARAVEGLHEAIERAKKYIDAGADAIFPEALETKDEFIQFRKEIKVPLLANMTEFGKTPYFSIKEFEEMGYNMVIFPLTAFRMMLKTVKNTYNELKSEGTQKEMIDDMLTRKELYDLIGYNEYDCIDKKTRNR